MERQGLVEKLRFEVKRRPIRQAPDELHDLLTQAADALGEQERLRTVLEALVDAEDKHGEAARAHREADAEPGSGQDLWAAESNLGQVLHEAKQILALNPPAQGEEAIHLPAFLSESLGVSRSEARRVIAQGGVRHKGEVVTAPDVPADEFDPASIQVGGGTGKKPSHGGEACICPDDDTRLGNCPVHGRKPSRPLGGDEGLVAALKWALGWIKSCAEEPVDDEVEDRRSYLAAQHLLAAPSDPDRSEATQGGS